MDTLRINKMQDTTDPSVFQQILDFFTDIAPWAAAVIGFWKFIDWLSKYMEDTRKSRVKDIVRETLEELTYPQMDKLAKSIDELKEAIWDLKKK